MAADKLLSSMLVTVPMMASCTGVNPFGIMAARPNTNTAPNAEPIKEYIIISIEDDCGSRTMQSVMINAEPSETPIMDGEAK